MNNEIEDLKALAEQGNAEVQYKLGLYYDYGIGVKQDDKQAVYWYKKAAEQGHAEAQFSLGRAYGWGLGVQQNDRQEFYWYTKAAEQGHVLSQKLISSGFFRCSL